MDLAGIHGHKLLAALPPLLVLRVSFGVWKLVFLIMPSLIHNTDVGRPLRAEARAPCTAKSGGGAPRPPSGPTIPYSFGPPPGPDHWDQQYQLVSATKKATGRCL
ncbi:hypothetical protein BKA66DRAFT_445193 [Pyrenochaeta sp. MPI-SDFR-AT-0127]|nr:hypothetical protein BKA66DRAFT_445193 [Pyrenochaeta sp. MPI-SDFR-AT-0127]